MQTPDMLLAVTGTPFKAVQQGSGRMQECTIPCQGGMSVSLPMHFIAVQLKFQQLYDLLICCLQSPVYHSAFCRAQAMRQNKQSAANAGMAYLSTHQTIELKVAISPWDMLLAVTSGSFSTIQQSSCHGRERAVSSQCGHGIQIVIVKISICS